MGALLAAVGASPVAELVAMGPEAGMAEEVKGGGLGIAGARKMGSS